MVFHPRCLSRICKENVFLYRWTMDSSSWLFVRWDRVQGGFQFPFFPHQYAGCVYVRLYCILLLWTPLLVEGHGPPCVKIGNASWACFSSLPWTEKEIYVPHCNERPSVSHVTSLVILFLDDCSFTFNWLTYHKMESPEIFLKWFCYIIPNVLLILGRVACSLIHESFAHILFYFSD